jgi:branched-chain amino acid transport system ATP-binding protein/branched-chain amino acid transport system permease protein
MVSKMLRRLSIARPILVPLVLILAVPAFFDSFRLTTLITAATYLVTALGFNIVFGYAGTISFGHAAFALLGAYTVALGQYHWQWSFALGAIVATVLCVMVGVVTALPSLRMAPFAIAVITLLYLSALNSSIQYFKDFTLGGDGVPSVPAELDTLQQWFLVTAIAAVAWLFCRNLITSPLGRSWELGRIAPELAESLGVNVTGTRLAAVGISSGLAGLAGAMWPILNGFTSVETFTLNYAILILVIVVVGGQASVNGPVAGSIVVAAITLGLNERFASGGTIASLAYALIVLAVVLLAPGGTIALLDRLRTAVAARLRPSPADPVSEVPTRPVEELIQQTMPETTGATLEVKGISWNVGAARVLDEVTLLARPGRVHGLIGPNGAGKTSLLNCVCGYLAPSGGSLTIAGLPLTGKPSRRSRAGLSRTFQHPALLDHRTVLENVIPGVESHRRATYAEYLFRLPRAVRERRAMREEAERWLEVVGLSRVRGHEARTLGPGQRRQLEIARALATRPKVLLLDEPAAGLTIAELGTVEQIIRAVARRGVAVILIEHHFDLVQRVCDEVTVLDAGRVVFRGTPSAAARDENVVEAYLGADQADRTTTKDAL